MTVRALQPLAPCLQGSVEGDDEGPESAPSTPGLGNSLPGETWYRWMAMLGRFNRSLTLPADVAFICFCQPALLPIVWGKEEVAAGEESQGSCDEDPRSARSAEGRSCRPWACVIVRGCGQQEAWSRE